MDTEPGARGDRRGSLLRKLLKLVVSIGLLVTLFLRIGPERILTSLGSVRPGFVGLVVAVVGADTVLRAYNWQRLLAAGQHRLGLGNVFYSLAVGGFFGLFVPSSFGPDLARGVALSSRSELRLEESLSSLVVLNLIGLWALALAAAFGAGALAWLGHLENVLVPLAIGALAYVIIFVWLLRTEGRLPRLSEKLRGHRLGGRAQRFLDALVGYRDARAALVPVFALALAQQVAAILAVYLTFRAGRIDLSLLYFAAFVPLITVARMAPLNIAGFGAEQGVVVLMFGTVGVAAADAFAMSVLLSLIILLVSAAWGLLYVGASLRGLAAEVRDARSASRGKGKTA